MGAVAKKYDHQRLYRMATRDFVAQALRRCDPDVVPSQISVIRCILLKNVAQKQLAGKLAQQRVAEGDLANWLVEYVCVIHAHYLSDHAAWRRLVDPRHIQETYDRLRAILTERYSSPVLKSMGCNLEEILASALLHVSRVPNPYRFDMPLAKWLNDVIEAGVFGKLERPAYDRRELPLLLDDEVFLGDASAKMDTAFESAHAAWGNGVDVKRWLASLPPLDQEILRLKAEGVDRYEIADRLNIKPQLVSDHLWKIGRQWRGL
jgi:hypothetical protein